MSTTSDHASVSAPPASRSRTFRKGFFRQYGILFALIPAVFLFVWMAFASVELRTASVVTAVACVLLSLIPFLQVGAVKVEPNRLTIETFFEKKHLSARQIKEIEMQAVRGRYGRVTKFVNIVPVEGKNYPVGKFEESEEVIYSFLLNWWNTYRDQ